jgi:hypothetical protein
MPSVVVLVSGQSCLVHNIAWGYDLGTDIAHITTNISPSPSTTCDVDFFHADEISTIADAESGRMLFDAEHVE